MPQPHRACSGARQCDAQDGRLQHEALPLRIKPLRWAVRSALTWQSSGERPTRARWGSRSLLVTSVKLTRDPCEWNAARAQQHQEMEQEVGGFFDHLLLTVLHARQRDLHAFFADFLRHAGN